MTTAIGTYATTAAVKARLLTAGITDTTDDALIATICDQVNGYVEFTAGRVLAPISSAVFLFDGNGRRRLFVPNGVRAVTLLEVASVTAGSFTTVPAGDVFLRPLEQDREPGFPATRIELSNIPTGSFAYFPYGYANVRVTMTTGFAAIPDEITDIALTTAVRAWHGRMAGQVDVVGTDETGAPVVSRFVSGRDRETLRGYRAAKKFGIGS